MKLNSVVFMVLVAACSWAADPAHADFGNCEDPHYITTFNAALTPDTCVEVARFEISFGGHAVPMRVIRARRSAISDTAGWVARVQALSVRLGPAMDEMGQLAISPVSVLLTSRTESYEQGPILAEAAHAGTAADGECQVTVYKLNRAVPIEEFVFTLAHELFHCIQFRTFPRQSIIEAAEWWSEGTAEYFAHVAQQGTRYSDSWFENFDNSSLTQSLLEMSYANVVFFLWLGGERGPSGVRSFMQAMPETGGRTEQLRALQGQVSADQWLRFAQAFLDGNIRQPGGRAVPAARYAHQRLVFDGPGSHTMETQEYRVLRDYFVFRRGTAYKLNLQPASGGIQVRMRKQRNIWIEPPEHVRACDSDKEFVVLAVSTAGGPAQQGFTVEAPERLDERACCLVGNWVPTAASLEMEAKDMEQEALIIGRPRGAGAMTCGHAGGNWTLTFQANGRGALRYNSYSNKCKLDVRRGSINTQTTKSGGIQFEWSLPPREREAGEIAYLGSDVVVAFTTTIGPNSTTRTSTQVPPPGDRRYGFTYKCTDTTLSIRGIYGISAAASEHVLE